MPQVTLVELPAVKLVDQHGNNYSAVRHFEPKGSAQIVAAFLRDSGYETRYINLKSWHDETELGKVDWAGRRLTKIAVCKPWTELRGSDSEMWGLTVNYLQEREVVARMIRHLTDTGGKVIVGGSDPIAVPEFYLQAGAVAVVADKSGKSNRDCLDYVATKRVGSRSLMQGASSVFKLTGSPMSPEDWPLPDLETVKETLGTDYWEAPLPPNRLPIGAVMLDIGCDRHCSFCQTPTYRLGYKKMSVARAVKWLELQARAGAKSVILLSDQFLGRVLWDGGRQEVIDILNAARDLDLALLYGNGIEMKKATIGRSLPNGDPTPDDELVKAIWGWDGNRGCAQAYLPAERPVIGPQAYAKLLPWKEHVEMLKAMVRHGLPDISYGVIVGLPDDTEESLLRLEEAVLELKEILVGMNPALKFRVTPYAIRPLPGTPQAKELFDEGLIVYDDPLVMGGFWTPCARTRTLSVEQVSAWQTRLAEAVNQGEHIAYGITGVLDSDAVRHAHDQAAAESRRAPRVLLETATSTSAGEFTYTGFSENISDDGIFIASAEPLPEGSRLIVTCLLLDGHRLVAQGEVRWTRLGEITQPALMPGMGIRWISLSDEDRAAIQRQANKKSSGSAK